MQASELDWAALLNPAPMSICLLGQLILVTLDRDVSLVCPGMDEKQFQLTRNPQSLQASMLQVANGGWHAFQVADKNMEQIRLLSLVVPGYVKDTAQASENFRNQ